jgi:hypothetical protein
MSSNGYHLYSHQYCPLQDARKDRRILEIIDNESDHIECRLLKYKDGDDYDTLSWCWGSRKDLNTEMRIVHENSIYYYPIPTNLYDALKELRRIKVLRIWIDFICIDQDNREEKNNQVPLMATIYGDSRCVYVWLGPEAGDSSLAMDFLENRVLNLRDIDRLIEDSNANAEWRAIGELIKRPWFTRRWIIQEIALAKDAYMLCGQKKIRWVDFADAISLFNEVETASKSLSEHMRSEKSLKHMPDFFGHLPALNATQLVEHTNNLFWLVSEREAKFHLDYLVATFTAFESAEPRDTIYALLALAKDSRPTVYKEEQPVNTSASTVMTTAVRAFGKNMVEQDYYVDYGLPLSDVYVSFTRWALERSSDKTRALDIICRPWAPPTNDEPDEDSELHWRAQFTEQESKRKNGDGIDTLPSWVPTTSGAAFARDGANGMMTRKNADTLVGLPTQRIYNASGGRTYASRKIRRGLTDNLHYHSLFVRGFIFDSIDILKEASQQGNIPYHWEKLGGGRKYLTEEYLRTLVADRGPTGGNAPRHYARLIKHAYTQGVPGDALNTEKQVHFGHSKIVGEVMARVRSVIWNRRMMATKGTGIGGGRRLGLVPQSAKKGDLICILDGCSVPVVLRQFTKTDAEVEEERKFAVEDALRVVGKRLRSRIEKKRRQSLTGITNTAANTAIDNATDAASRKRKREPGDNPTPGSRTRSTTSPPIFSFGRRAAMQNSEAGNRQGPTNDLWLRSDPKTFYQVIGECYIDGIMNGEAVSIENVMVLFEMR